MTSQTIDPPSESVTISVDDLLKKMNKVERRKWANRTSKPRMSVTISEKKLPNSRLEYVLYTYFNKAFVDALTLTETRESPICVEVYESKDLVVYRFNNEGRGYRLGGKNSSSVNRYITCYCTGFSNAMFRKASKSRGAPFHKLDEFTFGVNLAEI